MRKLISCRWRTFLLLLLVVLVVGPNQIMAAAPRATGYEIAWSSIDGGGAMDLIGGAYTLSGTLGQPDAGKMSGGAYELNGGFWIDLFGYRLYLPILMR